MDTRLALTLSEFSHLTDDSRRVMPNSLFCAYLGEKQDGRHYIKEAIDRGATAILYEAADGWCPSSALKTAVRWVPVKQLRDQLGVIAASFYGDPSSTMPVVGITGTNGKTSCAQFIAQALDWHSVRCAVLGTVGNGFLPNLTPSTHTTLNPIQLQQQLSDFLKQGAKAISMEVSSHALEQGRVNGVNFEVAVLTNVSRDHLDYHGSMSAYAQAKEKLFHQPHLKYALINSDDAFGAQWLEKKIAAEVLCYSALGQIHKTVPTLIIHKMVAQKDGFHVVVQTPWGSGEFKTHLLGRFNMSNLLAVLGTLCLLGVPLFDALYYLSQLKPVTGRMQLLGLAHTPKVIVDYAHTPDALKNALTAVREHTTGKVICVFGCGGDRDKGKRPLMAEVAQQLADELIITNDNPRSESPEEIVAQIQKGLKAAKTVQVILDRRAAIETAIKKATPQDSILIAGKGHENYQIINNQTLPFDDRMVAQQALRDFLL